ncbi:phosphotriesterase [Nakamurella sp. A5-74]|uniref:Phosphotriesterase n=1 Tax=Nakamurella sp. A5-74 TaxID=3158264 RepID=A0AAU8DUS9_9ACTN
MGASNDGAVARTVLGDVPARTLGVTNAHDHLMFASPLLPGQELDDPVAARRELDRFAAAGGRTVVQWTPAGLGRGLAVLPELSRSSGVTVIAATGRHRAEHHPPAGRVNDRVDDELLLERFLADLSAPVPCGIIKVGTGFHHIDDWERQSLTAAAEASRTTGCSVAVHLELGTAGLDVVNELTSNGVPPGSVILGHVGRNPDPAYQADLAATGVLLCFDGPSRANHATDWRLVESMRALAAAGHLGQLLLGGDTTTAAARSVDSGPGMPALLTRTAGAIGEALGPSAVQAILVENPMSAFAWQRPQA